MASCVNCRNVQEVRGDSSWYVDLTHKDENTFVTVPAKCLSITHLLRILSDAFRLIAFWFLCYECEINHMRSA